MPPKPRVFWTLLLVTLLILAATAVDARAEVVSTMPGVHRGDGRAGDDQAADKNSVRVFVREAASGKPIGGVRITGDHNATPAFTDESGYALLVHEQVVGDYLTVTVNADGYKRREQRILVMGGNQERAQVDQLTIALERGENPPGQVQDLWVQVTDDVTGAPVPQVSVELRSIGGTRVWLASTDAGGVATFNSLQALGVTAEDRKKLRLVVRHGEYDTKWSDIPPDLMESTSLRRNYLVQIHRNKPASAGQKTPAASSSVELVIEADRLASCYSRQLEPLDCFRSALQARGFPDGVRTLVWAPGSGSHVLGEITLGPSSVVDNTAEYSAGMFVFRRAAQWFATARNLNNAAVALEELRKDVDAWDRLAGRPHFFIRTDLTEAEGIRAKAAEEIGKLASQSDLCRQAAELQAKLDGFKSDGNNKLQEIRNTLAQADQLSASCATASDAKSIRDLWKQANKLDEEIRRFRDEAEVTTEKLQALLPQINARVVSGDPTLDLLDELATSLDATGKKIDGCETSVRKAVDLWVDYKNKVAGLERQIDDARKSYERESWSRLWPFGLLDLSHNYSKSEFTKADLDLMFLAAGTLVRAEIDRKYDPTCTQLEWLQVHRALVDDYHSAVAKLRDLRKERNARLCSASDQGTLNDIRGIVDSSAVEMERKNYIPDKASACDANANKPADKPADQGGKADQGDKGDKGDKAGAGNPANPNPPPPPPPVLGATVACTGSSLLPPNVLEIRPGEASRTCTLTVTGWVSNTTDAVVVDVEPKPLPNGIVVSPGRTQVAGTVLYSSGISDRGGEYPFTQDFWVSYGASESNNAITLVVWQENGAPPIRVPISVNIVAKGRPDGISLAPPAEVVQGRRGGIYSVWRYKLYGDPPNCFHFVAAARGSYGPPVYELVGDNMEQREADMRIAQLSRFFSDRYGCHVTPGTPPIPPAPPAGRAIVRFGFAQPVVRVKVGDQVAPVLQVAYADAPNANVDASGLAGVEWGGDRKVPFTAQADDAGKTFRITAALEKFSDAMLVQVEAPPAQPRGPALSRFGFSPPSIKVRVGDTVAPKVYATYSDAPEKAIDVSDRAKWTGDRTVPFRAQASDAGKTFKVTASLEGASDTLTIEVERPSGLVDTGKKRTFTLTSIVVERRYKKDGPWSRNANGYQPGEQTRDKNERAFEFGYPGDNQYRVKAMATVNLTTVPPTINLDDEFTLGATIVGDWITTGYYMDSDWYFLRLSGNAGDDKGNFLWRRGTYTKTITVTSQGSLVRGQNSYTLRLLGEISFASGKAEIQIILVYQ